MIAYKLVRQLKDGSLAPLFINKRSRLSLNKWLSAESHPTKGYAYRPGWHCTLKPIAPHLSTKGRIWIKVQVKKFTKYNRPESQGGTWILAKMMKIISKMP